MLVQFIASLDSVSSAFLSFMQKEVVYSSVLFLIVLFLLRIFKKQSLYLQYGLLAFVFVRLLLPPDLALQFSARSLLSHIDFTVPAPQQALQSVIDMEYVAGTNMAAQAADPGTASVIEANRSVAKATPNGSAPAGLDFKVGLFLVWLVGVITFAAIFLRRYFYYRRIIREAVPVGQSRVLTLAETWRKRFGIRRRVKLVTSDHCLSPFTMGIWHPIVYLPEILLKKSTAETIESVVAHELAHVQNLDDLWIKLQNLVQICYFFHPVVWLANSRLNEVRERICDERVLSHGNITPKTYGSSMLAVLKLNLMGTEGVEMLHSFGNHKKKFSSRILEIMRISHIRKSNLAGVYLVLAVLAVLLLPMGKSTDSAVNDASDQGYIKLTRTRNGEGEFRIAASGAGSRFQTLSQIGQDNIFCESNLPGHLSNLQYAAIGIYDIDYRKIWVVKGDNAAGETEFYLDTDSDTAFVDEKPLKIKRKTAKYNLEGSSEWVLTRYLKSQVLVDYRPEDGDNVKQMSVFLVYYPDDNFLQFENIEFWQGEATLCDETFPVALYGGLHSSWFLRPTFDINPDNESCNEIRIDFNRNGRFEDMTVFDPTTNEVNRERYCLTEAIKVGDKKYFVRNIKHDGDALFLKLTAEGEGALSRLDK